MLHTRGGMTSTNPDYAEWERKNRQAHEADKKLKSETERRVFDRVLEKILDRVSNLERRGMRFTDIK